MSQVYDMCVPQGFQAAAAYSGVCDSRIKLDTALIVSRESSAIVLADANGMTAKNASVLLFHHGLALPKGPRGQEIKAEVCQAAGQCLDRKAADAAFIASGREDGYFRPSRLVHCLKNLQADLGQPLDALKAVLEEKSAVKEASYSFACQQEWAALAGMAADNYCLLLTDAKASTDVIKDALKQVLPAGTAMPLLVMASGSGKKNACTASDLAKALASVLSRLGVMPHAAKKDDIA